MAVGLFINKKDLKRYTIIDGNFDEDLYFPSIEIAQELHLQNVLGSNLYNKIKGLIEAGTLSDVGNVDYKYLVDNFLNKATIFYTMVELLPVSSYSLSNNGLGKKTSELKDQNDDNELDNLIQKYNDLAEHYSNLCIKYICNNISKYPEYNTGNENGIYPDGDAFSTNWEI